MEGNIAKVLDNSSGFVDFKRKRSDGFASCITGSTHTVVPQVSTFTSSKIKRRKLDGERNKCQGSACDSGKTFIRYYANFKKTGPPKRVLFYENGNWIDFPHHVVGIAQKLLHLRKLAFEVEVNEHCVLLDFLHMIQLDLKSGSQKPIAWIDETNSCFFPEIYSGHEESDESCQDEDESDPKPFFGQPYELRLKIDINGTDCSKMKDCSVSMNRNSDSHLYNVDGEDLSRKKLGEVTGESQVLGENVVGTINLLRWKLDSERVRNMFSMGLSSFQCNVIILDTFCGSSSSLQARRELFQKQVEITQKYRGHANVRFAWLASSKKAVSSIMMYGLGHCESSTMRPTFGTGVHLAAGNYSSTSVNLCDDDENGVRYIILCRVVMGKMEVVHHGSKQFHPTSEEFDSGVDDLENPRNYVVWNMNMNTHIYPEYVVSFKVQSDDKGSVVEDEKKFDDSEATSRRLPEKGSYCQLRSDVEVSHREPTPLCSNSLRVPKSPWMPFPMLFEAISMKLPPQDMKLLIIHYDLFKAKEISRVDFVDKLRKVVGDTLLKTTLVNLQCKLPFKSPKCDVVSTPK